MDCVKLESAELRRSTRQSRNKVFAIELKPREALKRKRDIKHVPTMEECNTDEGSPDKIPKLQVTKDAEDRPENGDQINTVEMDVEEEEEEDADQNQNMSSEDESENCGEGMKSYSGPNLQDMDRYPYVEDQKTHITHKTNNLSAEKQSLNYTNTATACSVFRWLQWAVFLLASLVLGLMGYQHFPSSIKTTELQTRSLYGASFGTHLGHLRQLFPSQRPELWKRTEVHVRRHLNLTDPTEPVSLMLTSGRRAEKTLRCLAQQLAAAFSNTLNSSVLEIDGTSKSSQDSDQVKLDIDKLLEEAFVGGTQAAVIQRFEELPPGSTLIFYRYCDHENSAFKKVFLVFTVMLPVEELDFKLSLGAVEEQVQEALKEKFVSSDRTAKFNQMDVDKLSGLWSRISHLILPVAAEQKIEQHGCGEDGSL
ncbi:lamina-associated polypeptide 1B isoform X4 [Silurus meridionalis]|nr:lamina-associated polypeptide 1B isoform X4 [Silurus meridionalis]